MEKKTIEIKDTNQQITITPVELILAGRFKLSEDAKKFISTISGQKINFKDAINFVPMGDEEANSLKSSLSEEACESHFFRQDKTIVIR